MSASEIDTVSGVADFLVNPILFLFLFIQLGSDPIDFFIEDGRRCIGVVYGSAEFTRLAIHKQAAFDDKVFVFKRIDLENQRRDILAQLFLQGRKRVDRRLVGLVRCVQFQDLLHQGIKGSGVFAECPFFTDRFQAGPHRLGCPFRVEPDCQQVNGVDELLLGKLSVSSFGGISGCGAPKVLNGFVQESDFIADQCDVFLDRFDPGKTVQFVLFLFQEFFGLDLLFCLGVDAFLIILQPLMGAFNILYGMVEIPLCAGLFPKQLQAIPDLVMPLKSFLVWKELQFLLFGALFPGLRIVPFLGQAVEVIPPAQSLVQRADFLHEIIPLLGEVVKNGPDLGQVFLFYHELFLSTDLIVDTLFLLDCFLVSLHDDACYPAVDGCPGNLLKDVGLFEVIGLKEVGEGVLGQDAGFAELVVAEADQFHDDLGDGPFLGETVGIELMDQIPRLQGYGFFHAVFVLKAV